MLRDRLELLAQPRDVDVDGTTIVAGAAVRPWPVPAGARAPAIDPFLRREPP